MNKQNEDILRDFLQEYLSDYEHPVKKDVWLLLEKDFFQTKQAVRKSLWIVLTSVASILILVLCVLFYAKRFNKDQPDSLVITEENIFPSTTTENNLEEKSQVLEDVIIQSFTQPKIKKIVHTEYTPDSEILFIDEKVKNETLAEKTSAEIVQNDTPKENVSRQIYENKELLNEKSAFTFRSKKNKIQLSLVGKNFFVMNKRLDENEIQTHSLLRSYSNTNNIGSNIFSQAPSLDELKVIKYEFPINLSLLVRKNFNPKWGVETGISYTYLASKERWQTMEYSTEATNRIALHYLGIPAKVSYNLLNHKQWYIYLAGGGMIEKCISGEMQTTESTTGYRMKIPLNVKEWQLSCMGNVGIGYRIYSPLSIIVEPGFSYFPNDGSEIMTIRKDKPLTFNLQVGLRFEIGK